MTLKELRKSKKITQAVCAEYLGIPLRTYQNYETDIKKIGTVKYEYIIEKLKEYGFVDERHGILKTEQIKDICSSVFSGLDVDFCYLFGSYAKGIATESSDVDLLVGTSLSGLKFYGLVESLREGLNKNVDVLNREQLSGNPVLINEILKDGIKIYG